MKTGIAIHHIRGRRRRLLSIFARGEELTPAFRADVACNEPTPVGRLEIDANRTALFAIRVILVLRDRFRYLRLRFCARSPPQAGGNRCRECQRHGSQQRSPWNSVFVTHRNPPPPQGDQDDVSPDRY
ncbi:MAG: hypothetical protein KGJ66_10490 [Alphaproteobacteria bacterium]|nr:hypothetical protein [Alphaproteobacteria bacterium]